MVFLINCKKIEFNIINILFVAFAFSIPISKAGVSFFEILIFITVLFQTNFNEKWNLLKQSKPMITLVLFVIFVSIVILLHDFSQETLLYISKYKHFIVGLIIFLYLDKQYIKAIFTGFILGMFISELFSYGIFFEFIQYKNVLPSDPSPFMDHMTYSTFLSFTAIYLLIQLLFSKNKLYKIFYLIFFLTSTGNLFINGGRTGQLIFLVSLIILFSLFFKNSMTKAFGISVSMVIFILFFAFNFSTNFQDRFNHLENDFKGMIIEQDYTGSFGQRVSLWIIGLQQIQDSALFGIGIQDNVMIEQTNHNETSKKLISNLSDFSDHHNIFITTTLNSGIVGFFLLFLLFYYQIILKFYSDEYKYLNILFVAGFVLFSLTHNTFHTTNPMVFFALFLGIFSKISYLEVSESKKFSI